MRKAYACVLICLVIPALLIQCAGVEKRESARPDPHAAAGEEAPGSFDPHLASADFLLYLEDTAAALQVEVVSMDFLEIRENDLHLEIPARIVVTGERTGILAFLEEIESADKLIEVQGLNVRAVDRISRTGDRSRRNQETQMVATVAAIVAKDPAQEIQAKPGSRTTKSQVLNRIGLLAPPGTTLIDYLFSGKFIELSGTTPSASGVLSSLESSPLFKNVVLIAPVVAQGENLKMFKVRFELEGTPQ